ncbi:MAG: adenosylcobalamin-dependent ribonucleoside-diphosphate reductase [Brevinematales bacterium]|nr:adenosylcobalamin-dependent ribonucleoside-diphosphate reductase [Brevinematales bacterium]
MKMELSKDTLEWFGGDELRARVFAEKYALRDYNGNILEKIPPEMWRRVAKAISSVEETDEKRAEWEEKFYWLLEDFRMIPGGRIMFGAGQVERKATLLNCYVLPIKGDSIEDIYETMKEMARTYSYGGGVGIDISVLRPKGSPVGNAAYSSTGAVSFMDLYSLTTGTIGQSGRRGALMITIHCSHPDVEEFITIKNDPLRIKVRYANISVLITDELMEAVQRDDTWELWYPDIMRERDLQAEFGTIDINEILELLRKREDFIEIDTSRRSFYHFPEKNYFYVANKNEIRKKRIYRVIKAKDLWDKIIHNAWASAEPGLIFYSTMRKMSTSEYNDMHILTTNPCSEIPLEPYGDCCLGNVNLERFVINEFGDDVEVDWENLEKAVRYTVRFLDNVLEYNKNRHPLKEQSEASMRSRRIGVGFTGLGDMLIKMKIKYDSDEAIDFVNDLFNRIKHIAYDESVNLAIEKGTFPNFDPKKHLQSPFIKRLDKVVQEKIKKYGLRNVAILTVPPVGSGALLAGVTSGIEPVFALSYIRRSESLSQDFFKVYHPLVQRYMSKFGIQHEEELPKFFVTAHQIDPYFRVKMQATIQKHIDHSISSTVNLPESTTEKTISDIYFYAWKLGCKGITVYREGSREGVLITEDKNKKKETSEKKEFKRPRILTGETIKFRLPQGALYVTVNRDSDGVIKEVFINIGKSGGNEKADAEAIGRLISIYLQDGGSIDTVIKQLEGIKGDETFWDQGVALHSIPDAVAKALAIIHRNEYEERLKSSELVSDETKNTKEKVKLDNTNGSNGKGVSGVNLRMEKCPSCEERTLVYENGCYVCKSCGYTKCA